MADLKQVENAARTLLEAEGFGHVPFKYERGTARFGSVIVDTATGEGVMMTMCRSYAVVNTHERCLDNIRHEVAHLITAGEEIDDHGPAWKAQAIRLGLKDPLAQVSEHNTRIPWFFHSFISKDCAKTQVRPLDKSA